MRSVINTSVDNSAEYIPLKVGLAFIISFSIKTLLQINSSVKNTCRIGDERLRLAALRLVSTSRVIQDRVSPSLSQCAIKHLTTKRVSP